jgi:predicted RNA polymerase sigma factor
MVAHVKEDTPEKWENVLRLCNHLLVTEYSPVAALNRTYALSKVKGRSFAKAEAEKLNLDHTHYSELESDAQVALLHYEKALALVKTQAEKDTLLKKVQALKNEQLRSSAQSSD